MYALTCSCRDEITAQKMQRQDKTCKEKTNRYILLSKLNMDNDKDSLN